MLHEVIENGEAFKRFCQMIEAQKGDISYILHPENFEKSKYVHNIIAQEDGYIKEINALTIGVSAMKLGAGRETLEDKIDMASGILLKVKVGDKVKKGDVLCEAHTDKEDVNDVLKEIYSAYAFSADKVDHIKVIKEVYRG